MTQHTDECAEQIRHGGACEHGPAYPLSMWTPVQVDTELARLYRERHGMEAGWTTAMIQIHILVGDRRSYVGRRQCWSMTDVDAVKKAREDSTHDGESIGRALQRLDEANRELAANGEAQRVLDEEHRRRPWTRAFLAITSSGGHVHSSRGCSTCFPTTAFGWFPEYSGKAEEEIVADAGERACTVCFPSAPVDVLSRPSKFFSDDEKAAAEAREGRAAAKAVREAKRLEKALMPDGEPLKVYIGKGPGRVRNPDGSQGWAPDAHDVHETFTTLVGARKWLADGYSWGWGHPSYSMVARQEVAQAVAAKEGKDVEAVLAEAEKRAERRGR